MWRPEYEQWFLISDENPNFNDVQLCSPLKEMNRDGMPYNITAYIARFLYTAMYVPLLDASIRKPLQILDQRKIKKERQLQSRSTLAVSQSSDIRNAPPQNTTSMYYCFLTCEYINSTLQKYQRRYSETNLRLQLPGFLKKIR